MFGASSGVLHQSSLLLRSSRTQIVSWEWVEEMCWKRVVTCPHMMKDMVEDDVKDSVRGSERCMRGRVRGRVRVRDVCREMYV